MWALRRTQKEEADADIVISTAFKAKGREWDNVKLADDFLPSKGEDEDGPKIERAEARVFYVALTRGRRAVDVDPRRIEIFPNWNGAAEKNVQEQALEHDTMRISRTAKKGRGKGEPHSRASDPRAKAKKRPRKRYTGSRVDSKDQAIEDIFSELGL